MCDILQQQTLCTNQEIRNLIGTKAAHHFKNGITAHQAHKTVTALSMECWDSSVAWGKMQSLLWKNSLLWNDVQLVPCICLHSHCLTNSWRMCIHVTKQLLLIVLFGPCSQAIGEWLCNQECKMNNLSNCSPSPLLCFCWGSMATQSEKNENRFPLLQIWLCHKPWLLFSPTHSTHAQESQTWHFDSPNRTSRFWWRQF